MLSGWCRLHLAITDCGEGGADSNSLILRYHDL
jgi:hypothetical protein